VSHRKHASSDISSSSVNRRMTETHLSTTFWSLLWAHVLTTPHLNKKSDLNSLFTGAQLWKPQSVVAKDFTFVLWQFEKNHRLNAQKGVCISLSRTLYCLRGGNELEAKQPGQLVKFALASLSRLAGIWRVSWKIWRGNDRRKVTGQREQIYSF